ncbi:MAG: hypothetical protein KGV59_03805 [Tenacibaculum sp.]|nr:hypothetical protein [Tenacibaculum sp.]
MMTLSVSSQVTKDKVCVDKSTFKEIMKDVRLKDSLQLRYAEKSLLLDNYVKENEKSNILLEKKEEQIEEYQKILNKKNEEIIKASKRNKRAWFYGIGGVAIGVVVGVLISR